MSKNEELIQYLKKTKVIQSKKIEDILRKVDRGDFSKGNYEDHPQYIGYGATISAPHMHVYALEILENHLKKAKKVLDIGSGSGYLTTCMAFMTQSSCQIIGIDHMEQLIEDSQANISKNHLNLLETGKIKLVKGDARQGYDPEAPYDVIHVGASVKELPQVLVDQLASGGRLLLPIGKTANSQKLVQIDKKTDAEIESQDLEAVRFVPMTDQECQWSPD